MNNTRSGRPLAKSRVTAWCLAAAGGVLLACLVPAAAAAPPPKPDRVIAVGDIHGDLDSFVALLQKVQLIGADRRWTGGDTTFVQTGDYMDRGPKVRELLDFLMALEQQVSAGGGRAIVLMGNHEAMNLLCDVRDAPDAAYASFATADSEARREAAFAAHVKLAETRRGMLARADSTIEVPKVYAEPQRDAWMAVHPPGFLEYIEAMGPTGAYGKWLRARPVAVRVDDTVFVHGGLNPESVPKKLEAMTEQARKELERWDRVRKLMIDQQIALPSFTFDELLQAAQSELRRVAAEAARVSQVGGQPDPTAGQQAVMRSPLSELQGLGRWSLVDPNGPLWFRGFATWRSEEAAPRIDNLQRRFGPVRFVVGHTMTSGYRVIGRFSSRVFLIDTGLLSSYYQGGRASALEISNGIYSVITLEDRRVLYDPMTGSTK